jgi:hypothetical protein
MCFTTHRGLALPVMAVLVLAACGEPIIPTAAPDRPGFIIHGTPTGSDYGSVGALLFDRDGDGIDGGDLRCTGSLIAPTVFLTAAHCVAPHVPDPPFPPDAQLYVSFAPDLQDPGAIPIPATGFVYDPRYSPTNQTLRYDMALVFLPEGATAGLTPLQLPPAGALTALAAQGGLRDESFIGVGYGVDASRTGPPIFFYDGVRKWAANPFRTLQSQLLGTQMNSHVTGQGGTCYGDSGGPQFREGNTTTIYSVVSWSDFPCRAIGWHGRLDTPQARSFLGQYVELP